MSSMVDKQEIIDMIRLKSPRLELVSFEAGKSEAWRWFKRVRVDGAVLPYAVCNGCFKPVHYTPRDGTGGLRRHACPLTVAMAQAKTGLTPKTATQSSPMNKNGPSTSGNKRSGAATPDGSNGNGGFSSQASPRSRARRSATVPVSLTMWAAEKGLMDLTGGGGGGGGNGHHPQIPGLPSGGLSIASAFAALQGIVPRCSPYLSASSSSSSNNGSNNMSASPSSSNPQAHQQLLQLPPIDHHRQQQQHSNGSPKMADSALDLAMKKSSSDIDQDMDDDDHHHHHRDHSAVIPLEERKDRAQSIVDHILLNISQQHQHHLQQLMQQQSTSNQGKAMTLHDANQNEQMTSRFSIMPPSRSSSNGSGSGSATRRPRKRSNPDRAIPTNGRSSSSSATTNNNNVSSHNNNGQHHPDIEANLQMLAQVANEPPAVKRERISSPDALIDTYRYQMNGGQLTPTSQHSVPSPADVDGDHPHHRNLASTGGSGSSTGSSSAAFKSGASSPAQFNPHLHSVPAHMIVPSSSTTPPSNEASSSLVAFPNGHAHHDDDDDVGHHLVRIQPRSVAGKPIENFAAAMHQVLSQGSPESSLADSAQLMQLNDLTACLHSLLDLHKKSLSALETRMPVPELQKPAPAFRGIAVVDGQFKEISLDDYKGKYVVLFFYPLDFTFVCPTEIVAFSERADEFRKINCELIACSTDSHFCHLAWVNTPRKQGGLGSLNLPLLADKSAQISKSYGVYKEDEGLTFRGLFIIDEQQRLRQVTINDLPVGRSVDETLRLVQAFQFTDKHGEVCPAGWTPGKKSMKADPAGSKEYFEASN